MILGYCVMVRSLGLFVALAWAALGLLASPAQAARDVVPFDPGVRPGTIVISNSQRRLYFVVGDGMAIRYPVAVGKQGKRWQGTSMVDGKYVNPDWAPPPEVKRDNPHLPNLIRGGSPNNPMGPRAMTLQGGEYAIHGTTASMRKSVGSYASYGCIRMYNEDIMDLFERVAVGATVMIVP